MDVLVTGATGFVGGRLVPRLLAEGHQVRCLTRRPHALDDAPWRSQVQVVGGDASDEGAVLRAADGADAAYFLIHGMESRMAGLLQRETATAAAFREGCSAGGVRRIVYLGGLVDEDDLARTSPHMYARQQVGQTLRAGDVPVTELRAGIVLGAGSASFELLKTAAQAPVALAAPLTASRTQPVAVSDLLDVLVAVLDDPRARWEILDIGGADVLTYREVVARLRTALGRRPAPVLPVPYLPPEIAATVAAILTGLAPSLVLPLLRSAELDAVVGDPRVHELYPGLLTTGVDEAFRAALAVPVAS